MKLSKCVRYEITQTHEHRKYNTLLFISNDTFNLKSLNFRDAHVISFLKLEFKQEAKTNRCSPLIKENSACAAIAQGNLYNNDLPARSKFILLTKLHDVTLVLIEIQCLYNIYLDV